MERIKELLSATIVLSCFFTTLVFSSEECKTKLATEKTEKNLIVNQGFENGIRGWYQPKGKIDTEEFYSGSASLKIDIPQGTQLEWFGGYTDDIQVEPNTKYKISGWIQGRDIHGGRGASISYGFYDKEKKVLSHAHISEGLFGTFQWKKIESVIQSPSGAVCVKIGTPYMAYGTVWFDDISLTKEEKISAQD